MFARMKSLVKNHWKKVIIGGVALQVMYRLTGYVAQRYLVYQQIRTHNMLKRLKKQQLFEMMEENFSTNFHTWFELMKENIKRNINAEEFADYLKNGHGNKYENWLELKMVAFTNLLCIVYGSSMLSVLLRVQVNAISGMLYKQMEDTPPGLEDLGGAGDASNSRRGIRVTEELQQNYMELTRYLCTKGMDSLCSYVYEKAHDVVHQVSLKQKLSVSDIEQLFLAIRNQPLCEVSKKLGVQEWSPVTEAWRYMFSEEMTKSYLYPTRGANQPESKEEEFFRTIICEAYDLVAAQDARTVLKFLETHGVNHYLDRISEFITAFPQTTDSDSSQISEDTGSDESPTDPTFDQPAVPFAKLIPIMNTFINLEPNQDTWSTILLSNESLKSFSANIYESYSCKQFGEDKASDEKDEAEEEYIEEL